MRGTDDGATPLDGRSDAVRHDVLDGGMALAVLEPALTGSVNHGARHRMREMLLQAGRKAQDLVLTPAIGGEHAGKTRLCLGERAGLIKHNGVGLGKRLKVLGALDHDAHLGSIAHGSHDGNGTREFECARVVDHQCRRGLDKAARGKRDQTRKQEVPRNDLVGEVFHVRLALGLERVGRLHERDDRAQLGLRRVGAHAHQDAAVFHDVPANTSSPTLRSTASGSPVRVAWLTIALPCSTTPSMQMDMPVRTATRSPGSSSVAATLTSVSPTTFCALSGTSSSELMSSFSLMARV